MPPKKGSQWELQLDLWHKEYRKAGLATAFRCHPGVFGKDGALSYKSKGPPDYTVFLPGRVLVFDAKDCAGKRLDFKMIADHQGVDLEAVHKMGHTAGIMARLRGSERPYRFFWWSDINMFYWKWRHGEKDATGKVTASVPDYMGQPFGPTGWIDIFKTKQQEAA